MKKQAVISFDLDGTLILPGGKIHPADAEILRHEQPFWFIPASGRPLHSCRRALLRCGAFDGAVLPFPLVMLNGAVTYRPGEILQDHFDLPLEAQKVLLERLKKHKRVTVFLKLLDAIHPLRLTPYGEECLVKYDYTLQDGLPPNDGTAYHKVMCICEEPAPLEEIYAENTDLPLMAAFSMSSILEFTAPGVHKGYGVQKLREAMGIADLPLLAAGDGGNDLEMLAVADISFAPLCSPPEVRARAQRVMDTEKEGLLAGMMAALK